MATVADEPDLIDFSAFDAVYAFGDSLADSGTAAGLADAARALTPDALDDRVPDPTPADSGYVDGRFTNGANWVDRIFEAVTGDADSPTAADVLAWRPGFGLADAPGGVNFAVGGSVAIGQRPETLAALGDFRPDLAGQVDLFLTAAQTAEPIVEAASALDRLLGRLGVETDIVDTVTPDGPSDDALYVFGFGGNDLFEFIDAEAISAADPSPDEEAVDAFAAAFAAEHVAAIRDLTEIGADRFLVAGAPNAGVAPDVVNGQFGGDLNAASEAVAPIADAINAELEAALRDLVAEDPSLDIFFFAPDVRGPLEDPDAFGLDPELLTTPFSDALEDGDATVADLPDYAFIDAIHPTAPGHALLFEQAAAAARLTPDSSDDVL